MEQVLVVERKEVESRFPQDAFSTEKVPELIDFLLKNHTFMPRERAEYDKTKKQIIPYVVICQNDRYFMLKRLKKQTEARLHNKLSLGVGGHINPELDLERSVLEAGLYRELKEEVSVEKIGSLTCVGRINENTGGVSDYHMAIVYRLEAVGSVTVRETEKMEGHWATRSELIEHLEDFETWSRCIIEHLDCL